MAISEEHEMELSPGEWLPPGPRLLTGFPSPHDRELFEAGFKSCATETIRYLLVDEGLAPDHPLIVGLRQQLLLKEAMLTLQKLLSDPLMDTPPTPEIEELLDIIASITQASNKNLQEASSPLPHQSVFTDMASSSPVISLETTQESPVMTSSVSETPDTIRTRHRLEVPQSTDGVLSSGQIKDCCGSVSEIASGDLDKDVRTVVFKDCLQCGEFNGNESESTSSELRRCGSYYRPTIPLSKESSSSYDEDILDRPPSH